MLFRSLCSHAACVPEVEFLGAPLPLCVKKNKVCCACRHQSLCPLNSDQTHVVALRSSVTKQFDVLDDTRDERFHLLRTVGHIRGQTIGPVDVPRVVHAFGNTVGKQNERVARLQTNLMLFESLVGNDA